MGDGPSSDVWSWDRCIRSVRSLNGRLGFPHDPKRIIRFLKYEVRPSNREIFDEFKGAPVKHAGLLLGLLTHYSRAKETPLTGEPTAFREFSGGSAYEPVFKKRVTHRLAKVFGSDPGSLGRATKSLGGEELSLSTYSYSVPSLPLVPLTVLLYPESEEFSATTNVLFDSTAESYLPTEPLVILAELTAKRLERAAQPSKTG